MTDKEATTQSKMEETIRDSSEEESVDVLHMIMRDPDKQEQQFEEVGKKEPSNTANTGTMNISAGQTANDPKINEALSLMEQKDRQVVRNGNVGSSVRDEMLQKDQTIRASASGTAIQKPHSPAVTTGEERSLVTETSSVNPRPRHPTEYGIDHNRSSESSAHPGAYAIGGIGGSRRSNRSSANNSTGNVLPEPPVPDIEDGHGLPVANQVNDNSDLPVADMDDVQDQDRKNLPSSSALYSNVAAILFFVACLAGVIMVIASVARTEDSNKNTSDSVPHSDTAAPTPDPPTHNLTSNELLLLQSFPNYTLQALQEDPNSPQSLAYQWMLQDMDANNSTNTTPRLTSRIHQRFALATLFFATAGEEWYEKHNWLNHSIHECFWFSQEEFLDFEKDNFTYVEVNHSNPCEMPKEEFNTTSQAVEVDHGGYKHLWLHSNSLEGTLPPELYWLTSLRSLSMYNNEALTGSLSSHIGKLTKLEAINMGATALTGVLPTELGLLSDSFFSIAILNAQVEGTLPSELGLLTRMHSLLLDNNDFSGTLPAELGNASNLKWIFLQGSYISGTIPNWFPRLHLDKIYLEGNQLTGTIPTEIGLLDSVTSFFVYSNLFSSGTIPTQVGQMSNLLYLDFDDCNLSGGLPTEIGLLTKLKQFWAEWNSLTAMIPSETGQLSSLDYLMLGWNFLSGAIPTELGLLSLLDALALGENSLSGSLPDGLSPLLGYLDVTNNSMLTGTFPFVESLPLDSWVYLSGTQISGTLPESLCEIELLEFDCSSLLCGCDCLCMNETDLNLNITTSMQVANETQT